MARTLGKRFRLGDYLDDLVARLGGLLPKALSEGDTGAIHDARVATRRLRAALDLARPLLASHHHKPLVRMLRRLRRRLGPLRDADVMIEHLGGIRGAGGHTAAAQWAMDRLQADRRKLLRRAGSGTTPEKWQHRLERWHLLRPEMRVGRPLLGAMLSQAVLAGFDEFARRAEGVAVGRPAEGEAAGDDKPADDPHALRIAAKRLRYTLEMAQVEMKAPVAAALRLFKRMQDALGLWHDYVVLTQRLMELAVEEELALHAMELEEAELKLAQWSLRRASGHLGQFKRLWRMKGAALGEMVRARFAGEEKPAEGGMGAVGEVLGGQSVPEAVIGATPEAPASPVAAVDSPSQESGTELPTESPKLDIRDAVAGDGSE